MYVRDLMTPRVISITPMETLGAARQQLRENRIHHLLVIDKESVVGVLSYRDLIGREDAVRVADVMSRDIVTVEPWETVRSAASRMLGRTHGCLPVVNAGKVTGVLTTTDLIRAVSSPRAVQA